jgi:hypothetical protein
VTTNGVRIEPRVLAALDRIGEADIVVGIPSFNNARTIGHVVRAVSAGLGKHFPDSRAVIVNSDGGSTDGTPEAVAAADLSNPAALLVRHPLPPVHRIVTPYQGIPGKGSAFRTIFAIAERLSARACAVFDADLRSITPEWVQFLVGPVLERGFDFAAPLYARHKYDGTITNSIVYPMTRALYGRDLRQPIGGDFGFSGRLASHYLARPVWDSSVARFGIDIWMTTTAIAEGFRSCQSFLGAKIHDPKDPGTSLAEMLQQVVSSVFDLMATYRDRIGAVREPEPVPLFGFLHDVGLEPIPVNVEGMLAVFKQAARDLPELWERILGRDTLGAVRARAARADGRLRFEDPLWVSVVYDFAIAYQRRVLPAEQIMGALVPLYLGRTAAFVLATERSGPAEVEASVQALAAEYLRQKGDLIARFGAREV